MRIDSCRRPTGRTRRVSRLRAGGLVAALTAAAVLAWAAGEPLPFRQYPGVEYSDFELPTDYDRPAEWTLARLMYPSYREGGPYSDAWRFGGSSWTIDYPRADRHIAEMIRRLTVIDARSVEQPVNLDDGDDIFNWPWLYAVEVGDWELSEAQAEKLREYLLRGGFLMVDDFHTDVQWAIFVESMNRVFPNRPIVDVPATAEIFHVFWDLETREQIPGLRYFQTFLTWEYDESTPNDESGKPPHWRGIYDDDGRIMVAICHNMDLGDSVEHSDTPTYPEEWSAQGMRTFLNYVLYAMTH